MAYSRYLGVNKTVKFGSNDSYTHYGLILTDYEIGVPQRKIIKVSSALMQGDEDISDVVAPNKYENRKLSFAFRIMDEVGDYDSVYRKLCDDINGTYYNRTLEFNGRKYIGRASVNKWKSSKFYASVVIDVDAKPYVYDASGAKRYE